MSTRTLESLNSAFAARYPLAQGGTVDSINASAEKAEAGGTVESLQAAGAVRGFAAVSGLLQWVKATDNFYQGGELIQTGDYVQVQESDARTLRRTGRAVDATDQEVADASRPTTKAKS